MEQANAIPLTEILSIIGYVPLKKEDYDLWYYSPLLADNLSLFHVETRSNTWRDYAVNKAGDVVAFVCAYLESQGEDFTQSDALRWLTNMLPCGICGADLSEDDPTYPNANFVVNRVHPITNGSYTRYLFYRGIQLDLAKRYLKDARVTNYITGKSFSALALVNENGGYHLVNRRFKGWVAPKGVSVLRGSVILPPEVHLFKNFMDFLAVLTTQGKTVLDGDAIILNSLSNSPKAFPYIRGYTYERLTSWLDNTAASQKAIEIFDAFCANQPRKIEHRMMNYTYAGFRDVSAWHRHNLGLKP